LRGGRPAAIGFQLKSECAAVVQQDQVSYAGPDTKAAEDRGLYRPAPAAVRDMKPNEAGRTALAKMLADSTLNKLLGTGAAAGHSEASPSRATMTRTPSRLTTRRQFRRPITSAAMTRTGAIMCGFRSRKLPSQAIDPAGLLRAGRGIAGLG
jgi:hypothetical protein